MAAEWTDGNEETFVSILHSTTCACVHSIAGMRRVIGMQATWKRLGAGMPSALGSVSCGQRLFQRHVCNLSKKHGLLL